jgi:hypothetical protein
MSTNECRPNSRPNGVDMLFSNAGHSSTCYARSRASCSWQDVEEAQACCESTKETSWCKSHPVSCKLTTFLEGYKSVDLLVVISRLVIDD